MRALVVDDDATSRLIVGAMLEQLGHEIVALDGGKAAWTAFQREYFPLVVLDRLMPDLDGLELCRRIRAQRGPRYTYVILVTVLGGKGAYLEAMDAGADDYFSKPLDPDELNARLRVAERVLDLREELARFHELLPICAYCKDIRDEQGEWVAVERYLQRRTQASFSHGACPRCHARVKKQLSLDGPDPGA